MNQRNGLLASASHLLALAALQALRATGGAGESGWDWLLALLALAGFALPGWRHAWDWLRPRLAWALPAAVAASLLIYWLTRAALGWPDAGMRATIYGLLGLWALAGAGREPPVRPGGEQPAASEAEAA